MTDPDTPHLLAALRRAVAEHFAVERLLGTGAMGSVFLARDHTLDRPVAIKVIAPELAATRSFRQRFLQEARTVAKLRHHNIVTVYAAGESDTLLYTVMEYVPGESLRERLEREGRLDDVETARLLRELCGALAYAHAQGVVHRDIKPENVLLDEETGRALLADFGVARAFAAGDDRSTGPGLVVGSPRYMSPEQAAGEAEVDGRSDLYALGLVGWEMLAGAPPFTGPNVQAVLAKQITEAPPPLAERAPAAGAAVVAVLERALAKDPAQRWPDARAMERALAAATGEPGASGETLAAVDRAALGRPVGARTRRRRLGALAALLLAAVVLLWWVVARPTAAATGDPRRSFLVTPFDVLGDSAGLGWLREASVNMLALDLAQWTDLQVVDYERTLDLLRDAGLDTAARIGLEDARALARRSGAGTVVTGQVSQSADSLYVVARLFDVASGRRIDQAQHSAPAGSDPRDLFDRVARDLLQIAGAPAITPELARTTTSSLAAYRAYLDGVRALNSWQLARADSLFAVAVQADSTFALAHYKRALARGWRHMPDSTDVPFAAAAARHGGRLPARERGLVEGYLAMARGLAALHGGDLPAAAPYLRDARERYETLVRQDSTDAESWYGLGDAHFHSAQVGAALPRHWTQALRAFDRTLALDSTFHLAYAHKLLIYQGAGTTGSPLVVAGDSVLVFAHDSAARRFGAGRIAEARRVTRERAVLEARAWVAADPHAAMAHAALSDAYAAAGDYALAAQALRQAMDRPEAFTPEMPYRVAALEMAAALPQSLGTLQEALRAIDADSLRTDGAVRRPAALLGAANVAAHAGARGELERVLALHAATDPVMPVLALPAARVVPGWRAMLLYGMGVDEPAARRDLNATIAVLERLEGEVGRQARQQLAVLPYTAYLQRRDTTYLDVLRRWRGGDSLPAEIAALAALHAGDTATAQQLALRIPPTDTTTALGNPAAGLRQFARAELWVALGQPRRALEVYEAIDPARFQTLGAPDPRWPLWVRSFLVRGQLHEQLGEPAEAARDYERFLELWRDADASLRPQLQAARDGLARVRAGGRVGASDE